MDATHQVRIGPGGSIQIPPAILEALGLDEGTELACFVEDGAVVLVTDEALEDQLQAIFHRVDRDLAEDLSDEHRSETTHEHDQD